MRRAAATFVAALVGLACWHRLGTTYGSTRRERRGVLPGDDLVVGPQTVATHAVTLRAPPDEVWPWLVQVGWHRGGWYTPRWVDALLFPANAPSADRIIPALQRLEVGDFVPDGPPETGCGFVVREVRPGQRLVLESVTHLPQDWRRRGLASVHWSWSFVLRPTENGTSTRLVFRWRARTTPWWLTAGTHLVVVPADVVMTRGMFRGLSRRTGTAVRAAAA